MTFEDTLAAVLEAKLSPVRQEMQRMAAELGALRKVLPSQYVSVAEAVRILGVSESTVRRKVASKELPTKRVGRAVRIDLSAMKPPGEDEVNARVLELKTK